MTPSDARIVALVRLKPEVLDAIIDLISRAPDDYFVHTSAMLKLAETNGLRGCLHQELHHDGTGRVGKVKHAPAWETLRQRAG